MSDSSTKRDILKLQRVLVDALEDVKAKDIQIFNTEHLSPLFERVIIASGTSNRQTRALAASVRDAVRESGADKPRIEGEDNGEWVIVDCGAAVVHIMQPIIREYYRLEEIWGDKPVKMRLSGKSTKLVKAEAEPDAPAKKPKRAAAKPTAAPAAAKRAPAKPAAKAEAKPAAKTARKAVAKTGAKPAAKKTTKAKPSAPIAVLKVEPKKSDVKKAAARSAATKPAAKPAAKTAKSAATKPAAKKAATAKRAPATPKTTARKPKA